MLLLSVCRLSRVCFTSSRAREEAEHVIVRCMPPFESMSYELSSEGRRLDTPYRR